LKKRSPTAESLNDIAEHLAGIHLVCIERIDQRLLIGNALKLLRQLDSRRLLEIELRILELIGDTQYYLGEMAEAARTHETQAARAAETNLKAAELNAIEHLVMPLGFIEPDRGISFAERAVELSGSLNDPALLARAQMLAAGYRCVYGTWSDEDWELWKSAHKVLRQISASPKSALSTADPNLRAFAWELQARVAMAEQNPAGAEDALGLEASSHFRVRDSRFLCKAG